MQHSHRARRTLFAALAATAVLALAFEPGSATQLGPDAFGYRASDEVAYAFEDLSLSLTSTRVLAGQNDASTLVPIGFSFEFYGTAHNEIHVSTNGLLSFGESYHWFFNRELDSPDLIGDPRLIAPLWHDWNFDGELQPLTDAVYYETLGSPGSQRFVVQWNRAYNDTPTLSDPVTFQAVLYEGGDILFHYRDVTTLVTPSNNGGSATVGIRNAGGTSSGEFLQWSYDEPVLGDGQTILFTVPEPATASLLLAALAVLAGRRRP
jgi:PEP-CTERM motif-containing protein